MNINLNTNLERWSNYTLAAIQAVLASGIIGYLIWIRAVGVVGLVLIVAVMALLIMARLGRTSWPVAAVLLVPIVAGLGITASRNWAFLENRPSQYVGLQRGAAFFVDELHGKTLEYAGSPVLEGARLLTDKPFLTALELTLVDSSREGLPATLSTTQMAQLAGYARTDFWLGGYQHVFFSLPGAAHDDAKVYFFLTPPEWGGAVLVLPDSVYQEIR